MPAKTAILHSYYVESEDFAGLFNYRILRAGHIRAAADYSIERSDVAGHEFIYCLKGIGHIRVDGRSHEVHQGDLAWIPVRGPHAHFADRQQPWEILWVRAEGRYLDRIATLLSVHTAPVFRLESVRAVTGIYHAIFRQLRIHSLLVGARCDMLISSLVLKLFESRQGFCDNTLAIDNPGLARLIYQMHSHYAKHWTVDEIASFCNVSRSQLFRLFQSTFGQTPLKWLKNYRLSQARRLLVESSESISAISYRVGYNDPLHFSRDFRKHAGISPKEFRRQQVE